MEQYEAETVMAIQKDATRFHVLMNMPPIEAQALFWNYSSKKARIKEIDKLMNKEIGK